MRYSNGFRQGILRRVLPPASQSVSEVSQEVGISEQTIRNWMEKARNGKLDGDRKRCHHPIWPEPEYGIA
ncbi:MAG TPA: transposase [Rectinemataceae bacterium]|nr:transposase [Rectinemataceae bacterium]